MSDKKSEIK